MMTMLMSEKWVREIYGAQHDRFENNYTFCGALEKCYRDIAYYWNSNTRKEYNNYFDRTIIPAIKDHDQRCIWELNRSDYDEVIDTIIKKGYRIGSEERSYSESTIRKFRTVIYRVVYCCAALGLCYNVLAGTEYEINDEEFKIEEIEEKGIIKKSLTVQQEIKLYSSLTEDIKANGAAVGLLLMFSLGLRNGEACGLNYGDIKPLREHPDCHVAWIYKSTKIYSNKLQSGGKTVNSGRIIPVPGNVVEFLYRRKMCIIRKLREYPELREEKEYQIENIPICCNGRIGGDPSVFIKRCSADDLSNIAHEYFEMAGVESRQLAYIDAELMASKEAVILKEKDAKAYLLRRNFATHMHILGLTAAEMQYLIGHAVEDAYESRNEFVNEDRIYSMYLKLKNRPLVNDITEEKVKNIILWKNTLSRVRMVSEEPNESIKIKLCAAEEERNIIRSYVLVDGKKNEISKNINVLGLYKKNYSME